MKKVGQTAAILLLSLFSFGLPANAQTTADSAADLRKQLAEPWKANDWAKVESISRRIIASGQANTSDFRNLRVALSNLGRVQEATQLRLAIAQEPDAKSEDHNGVCWVYLEQNKPLEARPYCQKAVDLESTNWAASVNLGHTWLLAGDKTQAMPWYRKSLRSIRKEEDLKRGPLADFDLFIKNGWAVADARAGKAWYEQGWTSLQGLNAVRNQLPDLARNGQEAEAMRLALKAMNDSATLLGDDATLTKIFARHHVISAIELAKRQIKESPAVSAQQTIDSAFATVEQRLSPEELWSHWAELARAYRDLGQNDKALALEEKVLAARTAKLGADHPDTLTSMSNLAFTYNALGQKDKALALNEKTLAARTAKLGADHPDTLTSMNNLAYTYSAIGQNDKAMALEEKVLAAHTAKLGTDHPDTLDSMSNLACTYNALGQNDKALALNEKVLAARTAKLGADHPDTLTSMNNLASTYNALGQNDKALALNEKALAARTAKLGADHPLTLTSMENLSLIYRKLKQYAKAEALLKKYLPLKVARDGENNSSARLSMALLVRTEEALGHNSGFLQKYSPETQAAVKDKVARLRVTGD